MSNLPAAEEFLSWELRGACRGMDPEMFFPEVIGTDRGRMIIKDFHRRINDAIAVCEQCGFRKQCREKAIQVKATCGIWGGEFLGVRQLKGTTRTPKEPDRERLLVKRFGVSRLRAADYEVLAQVFGFENAAAMREFADQQQANMSRRAFSLDSLGSDARKSVWRSTRTGYRYRYEDDAWLYQMWEGGDWVEVAYPPSDGPFVLVGELEASS